MNEKLKTIILAMLIAGIITGIFVVQLFSTSFAISEAYGGNMSPNDFDDSVEMFRNVGIIVAIGSFFWINILVLHGYRRDEETEKNKELALSCELPPLK